MTRPLELRVLVAVNDGHQTLDALTRVLGEPAEAVDQRIRWLINERLLVPYQRGDTWTFDVTDAGQRMLAMRSRLDEVAGGGQRGGPAPSRRSVASSAPHGSQSAGGPGAPGPDGPTGWAAMVGPTSPIGSLGLAGLVGTARDALRSGSARTSPTSPGAPPSPPSVPRPSSEPSAPRASEPPVTPPVASSSGTSDLLSPTEEAQRAERAAWWFAVSVVGALVAVVLIVWVLATA